MLLRVASALVLVPLALGIVFYFPPPYYLAALAALGTICLKEYFALTGRMGAPGQPWFGYAALWGLLWGMERAPVPVHAQLTVVLLAGFVLALWRPLSLRERALGLAANLLGVFYVTLCLYPAVRLRFDFGEALGREWTVVLLATVWAGDTGAMLAGRTLGRTPFARELSPKKTNEGAAGGLLAGTAAAAALARWLFPDLAIGHVVLASLLVGVAAQLGDLAESLLKRAAEVKDSSGLIPGHGGALDRVDSLLFAIPVQYLYLLYLYPS